MDKYSQQIATQYGGKVRVRVSGVLVQEEKVLLVGHRGIVPDNLWWAPPGGGVEFGETLTERLQKEFEEESGIFVDVCDFLGVGEFLEKPLHAIELFFSVKQVGGVLKKGEDPEFSTQDQLIKEVCMMPFSEIKKIKKDCIHGLLRESDTTQDLLTPRGFFNFQNNI